MPLLQITGIENATIGTWFMTESREEMQSMIALSDSDHKEIEKFTSPSRQKEFLAVRLLLSAMMGYPGEIVHAPSGKPSLKGFPGHISISHSRNIAAIIQSDFPAGIDVEETGRNVTDIARRFLSEEELSWTMKSRDPQLARILCWSAKEAVYKMAGLRDLDFRNEISIVEVQPVSNGKTHAIIYRDGICTGFDLNFFLTENNVVAWCVNPL